MKKLLIALILVLVMCSVAFGGTITIGKKKVAAGETNFTNDANMISYWMMEQATGADAPDGKNANNVGHSSDGAGPTQSADPKQGTYSSDLNSADSDFYLLADTSLSAGFPGKNTTGIQTSFSVGAWVKIDASSAMGIISKSANGEDLSWQLYFDGTNMIFGVTHDETPSGLTTVTGGTAITDDGSTWYHVVGVFDSTNDLIYVYVNGTSDAAAVAFVGAMNLSASELYIGGGGGKFDGHIDEVFVMSRVLSATEVLAIYDHGLEGNR